MWRCSMIKQSQPMWQCDFCPQSFNTQRKYLGRVKIHEDPENENPENEEWNVTAVVEASINKFLSVISLLISQAFHK